MPYTKKIRSHGYGCNELKIGIACAVLDYLNVNLTVKESSSWGYIDGDGKPQGSVKDALSGTVDFSLTRYFICDYWNAQTYPIDYNGIKILSRNIKISFISEITFIFTHKVWLFTIISCLGCIVSLKHILNLSLSDAALEFTRMFSGAATLKEPRTGRIIMIILLFYIFVIGSLIQSWLSAIDTAGYPSLNIDSIYDLNQSKLQVYGEAWLADFIPLQNIRDHYTSVTYDDECPERLLKGDSIACLYELRMLIPYYMERERIHISSDNLITKASNAYNCAEDFPLKPTFNRILLKLKEGGFLQLLKDRYAHWLMRKYNKIPAANGLGMRDLAIIFVTLLVTWVLAIFIFIVEISINKIKSLILMRKTYTYVQ